MNPKNVDNRVRTLSGFHGFFETCFAAFILSVGNDNECFSAGLSAEFFRAGEVDSVIEMSTADVRRNGSGSYHAASTNGVHFCFVDGTLDDVLVVGEIA